jgi:DNA-binding protein Fis
MSLRSNGAAMPEVLRQNAPPVANDFLRSAGLSPDEIDLVRKLVGHTIAAVECGLVCETLAWRGGNRTHTANVLGISIRALRNKLHLYTFRSAPCATSFTYTNVSVSAYLNQAEGWSTAAVVVRFTS